MTDDELIAKAEKELASLTRCMSPDKVAKLEAHRLIALARIGAGEMAEKRPSENEIKLHNYDAALRNIAGGHFANASTLAINGEWYEAYVELQKIAKAALSAAPASPVGEDVVEKVVRAFKAVLLDIDFLIERGHLTDIRNDMIYTEARAALAAIGRT